MACAQHEVVWEGGMIGYYGVGNLLLPEIQTKPSDLGGRYIHPIGLSRHFCTSVLGIFASCNTRYEVNARRDEILFSLRM